MYLIHNLWEFLIEMKKNLENCDFTTNLMTIKILDENNILEGIENSIFVCKAKCTFCGRICDSPHETRLNKHECIRGHQFSAFAGVHWTKNYKACLLLC